MSSAIDILNSQGKESKTQVFTRPLRGVLGGHIITVETGKGRKSLAPQKELDMERYCLRLDSLIH